MKTTSSGQKRRQRKSFRSVIDNTENRGYMQQYPWEQVAAFELGNIATSVLFGTFRPWRLSSAEYCRDSYSADEGLHGRNVLNKNYSCYVYYHARKLAHVPFGTKSVMDNIHEGLLNIFCISLSITQVHTIYSMYWWKMNHTESERCLHWIDIPLHVTTLRRATAYRYG